MRDEEDRDGNHEIRHRVRHRGQHVDDRAQQEAVEVLAPGSRIREAAQDEAEPFVGQQEHERPEAELQHPAHERERALALQDFRPADPELPGLRMGERERAPRDGAADTGQHPQQK